MSPPVKPLSVKAMLECSKDDMPVILSTCNFLRTLIHHDRFCKVSVLDKCDEKLIFSVSPKLKGNYRSKQIKWYAIGSGASCVENVEYVIAVVPYLFYYGSKNHLPSCSWCSQRNEIFEKSLKMVETNKSLGKHCIPVFIGVENQYVFVMFRIAYECHIRQKAIDIFCPSKISFAADYWHENTGSFNKVELFTQYCNIIKTAVSDGYLLTDCRLTTMMVLLPNKKLLDDHAKSDSAATLEPKLIAFTELARYTVDESRGLPMYILNAIDSTVFTGYMLTKKRPSAQTKSKAPSKLKRKADNTRVEENLSNTVLSEHYTSVRHECNDIHDPDNDDDVHEIVPMVNTCRTANRKHCLLSMRHAAIEFIAQFTVTIACMAFNSLHKICERPLSSNLREGAQNCLKHLCKSEYSKVTCNIRQHLISDNHCLYKPIHLFACVECKKTIDDILEYRSTPAEVLQSLRELLTNFENTLEKEVLNFLQQAN